MLIAVAVCVALYAALYGERPYAGDSLATLLEEIERGRVRPEPSTAQVPRWLRRILLRGLSPRADDRYPKLDDMLH